MYMVMADKIVFISDRKIYNKRYRADFIESLKLDGFDVDVKGLFDSIKSTIICLFLLFNRRNVIVSSNIKSNIVVMVIRSRRVLIIMNGLGRLRGSSRFRAILCTLMSLRPAARFVVQNYADYRFFRRHVRAASLVWIPGSGGVRRFTGVPGSTVAVQRDEKIPTTSLSIRQFIDSGLRPQARLVVVGCTDAAGFRSYFADRDVVAGGYVAQDRIFAAGRHFVQPAGYGEGVPHTLVDAIVSGMTVYITRRDYLRFGFWLLGGRIVRALGNWCEIECGGDLASSLRSESVVVQYRDVLFGILESIDDNFGGR